MFQYDGCVRNIKVMHARKQYFCIIQAKKSSIYTALPIIKLCVYILVLDLSSLTSETLRFFFSLVSLVYGVAKANFWQMWKEYLRFKIVPPESYFSIITRTWHMIKLATLFMNNSILKNVSNLRYISSENALRNKIRILSNTKCGCKT